MEVNLEDQQMSKDTLLFLNPSQEPKHCSRVVAIPQKSYGFHAAPTGGFWAIAKQFQAEVQVEDQKGMKADGKGGREWLLLNLRPGSEMTIHTIGFDAKEALAKLCQFVEGLEEYERRESEYIEYLRRNRE